MSKIEEVLLERIKVGVAKYITNEFMIDVSPKVWLDYEMDRMCMSITAYIAAEKLQKTTQTVRINLDFSYPDGVWQMFKQKYFPTFLKNIFPIKENIITKMGEKTITFTRHATYPKLPLIWPKESQIYHVIKEMISESETKERLKIDSFI